MGAFSQNPRGAEVSKFKLGDGRLSERYNQLIYTDSLMYFPLRSITRQAEQT
jgi:hypothetical protein